MAIYHFSGQIISRSQGRSAVACASYRSAEAIIDKRTDQLHDFQKKEHDILYKEIILPKNSPEWIVNRDVLWNAVEQKENRKDAQLAREFNISLPKELSHEQNIELAKDFVKRKFVKLGMIADLCIHKGHKGNEEQPHMHVMLTLREITPNGFGKKVREWNDRALLESWREEWANSVNRSLALHGFDVRVDHRSNAEQGIELEPQCKLGTKTAQHRMARFEEYQNIARENGERIYKDPSIVLDAITKHQSTFTMQDLAKFVNRYTVDAEQFQLVYSKVQTQADIVYLGKDMSGHERFSTKAMLDMERSMLDTSKELNNRAGHDIRNIITQEYFSKEQQEALKHIVSNGDLKCVIGYAGSGKSTILNFARKTWEASGYNVIGVTLSGISAENLQGSSGIDSSTLASKIYYWDKGEKKLSFKDVLVVDEAGMLGSRQMSRLLNEAYEAKAKVVLIGDPQQLQAIEAGASFRSIVEKEGYVELTKVRRQQAEWQQEATKELAQGKVEKAIFRYLKHDNIHEFKTTLEVKEMLISTWNDARISNPEKTQIILAYTKKAVNDLNIMARNLRLNLNELGEKHFIETTKGVKEFAEGDRIYFLRNEKSLGVMNGTLGTIKKIIGDNITVALDTSMEDKYKRTINVNTNFYKDIDYGYATTIHKSQGITIDRSYVLASSYMDSHATYVALSRHRENTNLFYGTDEFSNARSLIYKLETTRNKDVTLDYGILRETHLDRLFEEKEKYRYTDLEKFTQLDKIINNPDMQRVDVIERSLIRLEQEAIHNQQVRNYEASYIEKLVNDQRLIDIVNLHNPLLAQKARDYQESRQNFKLNHIEKEQDRDRFL